MIFRGWIRYCERVGASWRAFLWDGRQVMLAGDLPARGTLVVICTEEEASTGLYRIARNAKQVVALSPEQDAEICANVVQLVDHFADPLGVDLVQLLIS